MKRRVVCLFLGCCCLLGGWMLTGCSESAEAAAPSEAASQEADGKVLYGIVSRINGNEIEVEYLEVTGTVRIFSGAQGGMPGGAARGSGSGSGAGQGQGQRQRSSDASGEERTFSRPEGAGGGTFPEGQFPSGQLPDGQFLEGQFPDGAGELPQMPQETEGEEEKITVTNITGSSSPYTRTGETATLIIPVGTPILTGSGTSQKVRTFNSLQSSYIISMTMKENAAGEEYIASIQVLQTA